MNEVTKLYENAGIEKKMMCFFECHRKTCSAVCEHFEKLDMSYPPFTAEKQLELIKWILKKLNFFSIEMSCNEYACADSWISCYYRDSLEESIANYFNTRWQDLTDAEKAQIKEILE